MIHPQRVYFAKAVGQVGPIKIGCTTMTVARMNALSAWAPYPIELLVSIPGTFTLDHSSSGHISRSGWPPKFWTGVTPMAFEPGMFVVCVDASIRMEWRNPHLTYDNAASLDGLVRGAVYTIAHYGSDGNHPQPMVWLEEISRPLGAGFDARRFRPLKDESLSVFRQALEPSPKQTEAA